MGNAKDALSYSDLRLPDNDFDSADRPLEDITFDIPSSCEKEIDYVTLSVTDSPVVAGSVMSPPETGTSSDLEATVLRAELAEAAKIRAAVKRSRKRKTEDGTPTAPEPKLWRKQFDELVAADVYDITIGYWRVSSTHQTEGYGAAVQRKHVIAWCTAKQTSGEVSERGVDLWIWDVDSGREESREGFEFVRSVVETGRVARVVAYRYDRFARNQFYAELIHREFRPRRTALVSATEDLPKGPLGELMRQVIQALGQYEAALISERLTRGKREAVRQNGTYYGGMTPFGYLAQSVAGNGKGQLKICEPEAKIVRLIFNLFSMKYTPYAIADYLNEQRIPRRNLKQTWNQSNVNRILHKEAAYRAEGLFGSLSTDSSVPAQDPILPHRSGSEERKYMWGVVETRPGYRVPPEGIGGQPIKPAPKRNSVANMSPQQAACLLELFTLLDSGKTYAEVCEALNAQNRTTLKGAPWTPGVLWRYIRGRVEYEKAAQLFGGDVDSLATTPDRERHAAMVLRERAAISRIRELRKQGLGLRPITKQINDEGHTTMSGNKWYVSSVERVIKGLGKASDRYNKPNAGNEP